MGLSRRLLIAIYALAIIIAVGVIGYIEIEHWSFLDALYMTIMTITTVGYGEVYPLSRGGELFSIFLMVGGVGGGLYTLTLLIQYVLEGQFGITMGRRRMKTEINKLKEHFILCGYGRVGRAIARTFSEEGVPFVVVDNDENAAAQVMGDGYLFLHGDATSDEVLKEARIETARGLVAAVGSDVDNTYITISARGLCPDLFITARASSPDLEVKLKRAGANRVVSPDSIGAHRMAMLSLRPAVVDFIDRVAYRPGREMVLESIDIAPASPLTGLTVAAGRQDFGITVLAMRTKDGKLLANPPDSRPIEAGDRLVIIGTRKKLAALESAFKQGR